MSNSNLGGWGNPPIKEKGSVFSLFFIIDKQYFNFKLTKDDLHNLIRP
jgi:hypothetical protein